MSNVDDEDPSRNAAVRVDYTPSCVYGIASAEDFGALVRRLDEFAVDARVVATVTRDRDAGTIAEALEEIAHDARHVVLPRKPRRAAGERRSSQ